MAGFWTGKSEPLQRPTPAPAQTCPSPGSSAGAANPCNTLSLDLQFIVQFTSTTPSITQHMELILHWDSPLVPRHGLLNPQLQEEHPLPSDSSLNITGGQEGPSTDQRGWFFLSFFVCALIKQFCQLLQPDLWRYMITRQITSSRQSFPSHLWGQKWNALKYQ